MTLSTGGEFQASSMIGVTSAGEGRLTIGVSMIVVVNSDEVEY